MKKTLLLVTLSMAFALSASASQHIVVNLSQQRACAYEGSRTVFCGHVSSGKPGHRTPTGHFHVMEKDIDHRSSKYPKPNGGAKMHYMLRITGGGIAMHLGHTPNYPASHGCIRMQNGFAQQMYRWAHVGTPVSVIGRPGHYSGFGGFSGGYRTASAMDILSGRAGMHHRITHTTKRRKKHSRRRH